MANRVQSVKGTRDLLPAETAVWAAVEATARRIFASYGYGEIRTPMLESTELFVRGVGESTDIVGKEMYTFDDRKGRSLTLRPESTAPVARAFIQHGLERQGLPAKLYYCGPQFRYERPQRGRYRQFSQIGAELIGDPGPTSDAELLLMLVRFLEALQLEEPTVLLNTVGDSASRVAYRVALLEFLEPHRDALSEDSRRRLETNPLRILDTKVPHEREILVDAPRLEDHLTPESREHFDAVRSMLEACGVRYRVDPRLVRGLDYYSRTVFEIVVPGLGAQDAVVGGGRYDGLIAELGGGEIPAIGFAIGEDRLLAALPESFSLAHRAGAPVYLIADAAATATRLLQIGEQLRSAGLGVVAELTARSVKAALRRAGKRGVRWVVFVAEEETGEEGGAGELRLKDLDSGEQTALSLESLVEQIKNSEQGIRE